MTDVLLLLLLLLQVKKDAIAVSLTKGMRVRSDGPQLISALVQRQLGIDCSGGPQQPPPLPPPDPPCRPLHFACPPMTWVVGHRWTDAGLHASPTHTFLADAATTAMSSYAAVRWGQQGLKPRPPASTTPPRPIAPMPETLQPHPVTTHAEALALNALSPLLAQC